MRPRIATWLVLSATLFFCFGTSDAAEPRVGDEEPAKAFVGYVYQRPQKINYSLYTHLCHAFVVADEDGEDELLQALATAASASAAGRAVRTIRRLVPVNRSPFRIWR